MYGLREMSDLAKLVSRHLKAKFESDLVRINYPKIIYVILFKEKIDILSFIGFWGFPINKMTCLLFSKVSRVQYKNI
jgi:hypothetical protein